MMKVVRSLLLVGCMAYLLSTAAAKTYSQKTFLMPRSPGQNVVLESASWHRPSSLDTEDEASHHLQWPSCYQASVHKVALGTYFGIGNGSNSFIVGPEPLIDTTNDSEVYSDYIIHDYAVISDTRLEHPLMGRVSFNPEQKMLETHIDGLREFGNGLYMRASLPIVSLRNSMHMKITSPQPAIMKNGADVTTAQYNLIDYFKGEVDVCQAVDDADLQTPLTHAKIADSRSRTGLSDLDVQLGYKWYQKENAHIFLNAALTLPTSNTPKGEWLFEPVCGNGGHTSLGCGVDAGVRLWEKRSTEVTLTALANYRFMFHGTERRTLSLKPDNFSAVMGHSLLLHYALLAENGASAYTPLMPAANLLTQKIMVKPGSSLDTVFDLSVKSGQFVFDLGYNLFLKDKEAIKLKDGNWQDGVYGIATSNMDTSAGITINQLVNHHLITTADFDIDAARSPAYLTNKLFGSLGYNYTFADKYPCVFGIGLSYEFAQSNNALEAYSLWTKSGISF